MAYTDKKNALMACARDLIQRVGVNAMSFADLGRAVGISKASVHHHFPHKEDLIIALIGQSNEIYGRKLQEIFSADLPALEKLRATADIYAQGVCKDKMCLIGILSAEYATLGTRVREALNGNAARTAEVFAKTMRGGVEEGTIAPHADSVALAHAFHSTILGAQVLARCSGDHELFGKSVESFLKAISAR